MSTRAIITGGSGFIGTNLIELLNDNGFEVLNIDILPPRNSRHNCHWQNADIRDLALLEKIIVEFNPEYIVHLAARTDLNGLRIDDYTTNTIGTENICKVLSVNNLNVKKVIFTSSMLVCKLGYVPVSFEDYCPSTFYGQSKVSGEQIVKRYSDRLPSWSIIRPTSIWGPWFDIPYIDFFHIAQSGKFIFPLSRTCIKTYGYVENSSNQIYKLLLEDSEISNHKFFFIGDDPPINIGEWANEICILNGTKKNWQVPFFVLVILSLIGDFLIHFKINFPMTTFRLKNMTINNIIPLENTLLISGPSKFDRAEGTQKTLKWMNRNKQ
jgi:GlcNAc-P-P-Und epimerase